MGNKTDLVSTRTVPIDGMKLVNFTGISPSSYINFHNSNSIILLGNKTDLVRTRTVPIDGT